MTSVIQTIEQLQGQIHRLEGTRQTSDRDVVSSGCEALDRIMPMGGLMRGTLAELLSSGPGSGGGTLALQFARRACQRGGVLVVVDRQRRVYPPALAAWGIDLSKLVLVYPESARDESWVWDQSLRCPGVAAVWGWIDRLDGRLFRRLQLSAESSRCLGLLVRPAWVRAEPSWADLRLWVASQVSPAGRRIEVELMLCRGGRNGARLQLAWDEWTGELRETSWRKPDETYARTLAAQLARATAHRRPAGTGRTRSRAV